MQTKTFTLFLSLFLACAVSAGAQTFTDEMLNQMHEHAARQIEAQLAKDSAEAAEAEWDELYRTSDEAGERSAGYRPKTEPPKGKRIGAVCMDDTRLDHAGRGACSGHGGVRFWIYQTDDDSIFHHPTDRHWAHPEPLTEEERYGLSSTYEKGTTGSPAKRPGGLGWSEAIMGVMAFLTIGYIAKLWFERHA